MIFRKSDAKHKKALLQDLLENKRYRSDSILGKGGMGKVERYFDKALQRVVAVKSLREERKKSLIEMQYLLNEARLTAYLQHPGIVPIYDAFTDYQSDLAYAMQLIEGKELTERIVDTIEQGLYQPLSEVLSIFTKVCETMDYVHDKGVIHLDLKPDNIMSGSYGEVLIVDWGNAHLHEPSHYKKYLQDSGFEVLIETFKRDESSITGTPPYMALEQFTSKQNELGPASDIFALGVILYFMLTHEHPYPFDGDVAAYIEALKEKEPKPPHVLRGDLPLTLSQLCMRMIHKDPSKRFQSVKEILQELKSFTDAGHTFAIRKYKHGEIIFRQGDEGDYAFLILAGYVEIYAEVDGERKFLTTRGEGDIVGELAVFTQKPRTATVKAIVPTTIKIMRKAEIDQELEKLSPWVGQVIQNLSEKFIDFTHRYTNENK